MLDVVDSVNFREGISTSTDSEHYFSSTIFFFDEMGRDTELLRKNSSKMKISLTDMSELLSKELLEVEKILGLTSEQAIQYLKSLPTRSVACTQFLEGVATVPKRGVGTPETLKVFEQRYGPRMTGSTGPRFYGYVVGGTTPAAIAADWLVSAIDQNAALSVEVSAANCVEQETLQWLRTMFGISEDHSGTFLTGSTMSNFVGLALARQWAGHQRGLDIAQSGLQNLPPTKVFSATPHVSIYKAMAMLGIGRNAVHIVPCLPGREAVDISKLRLQLSKNPEEISIVVANAGTVDSADFDDLSAIAELKRDFNFWLHVDAAFGGYAACSPKYRHLVKGLDAADSIAIDAHKWLNVPYDSAVQFTRHPHLQLEMFKTIAAYVGDLTEKTSGIHYTPECSRRMRSLPAWFSLMAYGTDGVCNIIERGCEMAQLLGQLIEQSGEFKLLAPVRLNVVCFTLDGLKELSMTMINNFLHRLIQKGGAFLSQTVYADLPGIRAAFSNWRTEAADVELCWTCMLATYKEHMEPLQQPVAGCRSPSTGDFPTSPNSIKLLSK